MTKVMIFFSEGKIKEPELTDIHSVDGETFHSPLNTKGTSYMHIQTSNSLFFKANGFIMKVFSIVLSSCKQEKKLGI